ncbi:MAG: hypothetical protein ACTHJ0_02700 [Flavipsychrobacter sp.]
MKPSILVLYYTQTGQIKDILDNVLADVQGNADITYTRIEPVHDFPFPWKTTQFFDAMPESVQHIPIEVKPLSEEIMNKHYDLVVLGYQPWFLNPSQPVSSFLQSPSAAVLKDKPVVTVIGCRNMWLHGQEKVKAYLQQLGAKLVGNIVLTDTNTNLISLLTIIRWAMKGQKEASGWLPAAGVQEVDVKNATRFGKTINKHLIGNDFMTLQDDLLKDKAVVLNPGLVLLEQRGIKNFRYWAKYIREKGGPKDPNRVGRIKQFKNLLLVGIFVLSPISSVAAFIKLQIKKRTLLKDVDYFKNVTYEQGRI